MKNNQFSQLRENDRKYDFAEAISMNEKKFVKKRSHKRSRQQIKKLNNQDMNEINKELMEECYG